MFTRQIASQTATQAEARPERRTSLTKLGPLREIAKGVVLAGMLATVSLTALPTTAHAGHGGNGAAIGLGILGGVLAGAAIAATAPPVYAAPPSRYYYPPQGYYSQAPGYYYGSPAYYGAKLMDTRRPTITNECPNSYSDPSKAARPQRGGRALLSAASGLTPIAESPISLGLFVRRRIGWRQARSPKEYKK